ncbi:MULTISPECIES: hypothetical protein [Streptomyces]|uniref:hypothetical protein n=1 Tax=Streptomyces TaxID=1883 RepID=UPI000F1BD58E|nr:MULTISPECIES: hypothetical protein [Streptomyces]
MNSGADLGADPGPGAVRMRRVNRWLVEDIRENLGNLYEDSCATAPGKAYRRPSRQDFLSHLTDHIRRPGFAMVIAETDSLTGCAFGFPVLGDGRWWLGFDGVLPRTIERITRSGSVFAISDTLVRPHPQDQKLAHRLQEKLLTDHQATLGATLVDQADRPTLDSLHSSGWLDIGELRRPTSPTTFRALVLPLGERTTTRLEGLAHEARIRWPG